MSKAPPIRKLSHSPQHPLAAVVLDDLILDVDLVAVALPDRQHGVFATRGLPVLYAVVTGDVARVDARVVGRLNAARSSVAALQDAVAVRPWNQVASPRREAAVAVPQTGVAASQELVGQLEVEIVADTLGHTQTHRPVIATVT